MAGGVPRHLEQYLGQIEVGWSRDADDQKLPFQVVRFSGGFQPGTIAFSTLGLSQFGLTDPISGSDIHHELLTVVPESLRDGPIPGVLQQVGQEVLAAERPLLRGEVVGPRGPLVPGSAMEAFYLALPVYLPDEFAWCAEGSYDVAIAWLVPISHGEAAYVAEHGWDEFEQRLVEADPDLTDIFRAPMDLSVGGSAT
jgi:hypothetical protein